MLILARKQRQKIILLVGNERIEIDPVAILPGKVRLGFTASENVAIWREELEPGAGAVGEAATVPRS